MSDGKEPGSVRKGARTNKAAAAGTTRIGGNIGGNAASGSSRPGVEARTGAASPPQNEEPDINSVSREAVQEDSDDVNDIATAVETYIEIFKNKPQYKDRIVSATACQEFGRFWRRLRVLRITRRQETKRSWDDHWFGPNKDGDVVRCRSRKEVGQVVAGYSLPKRKKIRRDRCSSPPNEAEGQPCPARKVYVPTYTYISDVAVADGFLTHAACDMLKVPRESESEDYNADDAEDEVDNADDAVIVTPDSELKLTSDERRQVSPSLSGEDSMASRGWLPDGEVA